jgi:hypothetical protein
MLALCHAGLGPHFHGEGLILLAAFLAAIGAACRVRK